MNKIIVSKQNNFFSDKGFIYSFKIYFKMLKSYFERSSDESLPLRFSPSKEIYEQVWSGYIDPK